MSVTVQVVRDHLALLAVAKPSPDDCPWVKQKASEVFEFSGGEKQAVDTPSARDRRAELIEEKASQSLIAALEAMTKCATALSDPQQCSPQHLGAVEYLLKTLRNLARIKEEAERLVFQYGVLPVLCEAMRTFEMYPETCKDCLGVLANCAVPPQNRRRVFSDCAQGILDCMHANASDVRVSQNGCACIANLSHDIHLVGEIGPVVYPVLVEVAMLHSKDAVVAENAMTAISALLLDSENVERFLSHNSSGLVELLSNLMRLHARNLVVNEQGLRSMFSLAQSGGTADLKSLLVRGGALSSVHSAMANCPFPSIAEWACKTIRALSHNQPDMKVEVYKSGAAGWVADAVRGHGTNARVVKAGLAALWSLANHVANKASLVNKDQVDVVIVNAMRLNPEAVSVALTGSAALTSLANDYSTKKKLVKNGCVTAVVHAMNAHPTNALVSEYGCACIWSLCIDREVQQVVAADSLAARAVLDAMTQHSRERAVVVRTLGALESLAQGQTACNMLVACGAVPIVASLVRVYVQVDLGIMQRCCNVLASIARYCDDNSVFDKYGVAEIAVDIQRMYPADESCNRAAERLLTALEGGRGALATI